MSNIIRLGDVEAASAPLARIVAQAAEPLVRGDSFFRELVDALPAAVYTTDAEGRITYFNDAAASLWRHRPELGKFARKFYVGFRAQAARELAFHHGMAGKQRIHFLVWQYNQSCNPSEAAKLSSLCRMEMLPIGSFRLGNRTASPLRQSSSSSSAFTGPTAEGESDNVR